MSFTADIQTVDIKEITYLSYQQLGKTAQEEKQSHGGEPKASRRCGIDALLLKNIDSGRKRKGFKVDIMAAMVRPIHLYKYGIIEGTLK